MKKAAGLDSSEFLERYTVSPFTPEQKFPAVLLKMDPDTKKSRFVSEEGCGIYADRPWACRVYPLGVAQPQKPTSTDRAFHFLVREDLCHGHQRGPDVAVRDWLSSQGVDEYEAMGAPFRDLMLHDFWDKGEPLSPEKMDMYYMACYDIDRFRRFVFETRFLSLFEIDEARVEAIRTDDVELLDFAMQWLRFCLFNEKTMKMRKPAAPRAERQPVPAAGAAR